MQTSFYLVFSENGIVKMNKQKKPSLRSGERGVEMTVEIPDAFFEQPFPEIEVEFDKSDIMNPSVSVRVEETKEKIVGQFSDLFEELPDNRKEYARDLIWDRSQELWNLFFSDESDPLELRQEDISVSDFAYALEITHQLTTQNPELPPEYRE